VGYQRIKFFGLPAKVENTHVRAKIEKYTRAITSARNNKRRFASTPKNVGATLSNLTGTKSKVWYHIIKLGRATHLKKDSAQEPLGLHA
jgi:hypothetical protein